MILTNYDLPVFQRVCHFVSTSYLGEAYAPDYKDNQTGNVLDGLLAFVFVPVTVSCAASVCIVILENRK